MAQQRGVLGGSHVEAEPRAGPATDGSRGWSGGRASAPASTSGRWHDVLPRVKVRGNVIRSISLSIEHASTPGESITQPACRWPITIAQLHISKMIVSGSE